MFKRSFFLLAAVALLNTSCEQLCEKGLNPFCEEEPQPQLGKWTEKKVGPHEAYLARFSVKDKGYVGTGGSGFPGGETRSFYSYSPATDTWEAIASLPSPGRYYATGISGTDKGFVGGGLYYDYNDSIYDYVTVQLRDFYEYNPEANQWTKKADLPGEGGKYTGFGIGNNPYILQAGKLWAFDASANQWNAKADCPAKSGQAFSVGVFGYVLNGTALWQYNPIADKWTAKANAPIPGAVFGTSTYGLLFQDADDAPSPTYTYNPTKDKWTQRTSLVEPETEGHSIDYNFGLGIGNKGYVSLHYRSNPMKFYEFDPSK